MASRKKATPTSWPASDVKVWKLKVIKPYEKNARTHPDEQIRLLADLMKKHGVDQPIVVDEDGVILKGHGRRLAALLAGFDDFPVAQHTGLSAQEKIAIRLADNQVALLSGWDANLIQVELGALKLADYPLEQLGFSSQELAKWTNAAVAQADPEDAPATPVKSMVRVGDIWTLGPHRLICGDSAIAETWENLFGMRERAAMVFTDPPYGVSYEAPSGDFEVIQGDKKRRDDLYKMLLGSLRAMVKHADKTAAFYIWHASSTRDDFADAMKAVGLAERQYLMWVKPSIALGRADYQWQHEPCFYASRDGQRPAFYADRAESTVWHVSVGGNREVAVTIGGGVILLDGKGGTMFVQASTPKNKKARQVRVQPDTQVFLTGSEQTHSTVWQVARETGYEHPTQKPVELARRAIENSSKPGEIVADGFLGSGTTLIGAEMTGRRCYGVELDPRYAEVIIRRWQKFANAEATLDGVPFEQVMKQRRKGGKPNAPSDRRKPLRGQRKQPGEPVAEPAGKHPVRARGVQGLRDAGRKPDSVALAPDAAGDPSGQ